MTLDRKIGSGGAAATDKVKQLRNTAQQERKRSHINQSPRIQVAPPTDKIVLPKVHPR
jgi:hypothetical protein